MSVLHLCLLIVALLPFPWTMVAKLNRRYDNRTPRTYLAGLDGWRARAHAAHQNAWEALALFTAAVVVAGQSAASSGGAGNGVGTLWWLDALAITFVLTRVLHGLLYLANWASLRSLVWFVGLACVVSMFIVAH
ncbi:MAPEG family protein [Paraburkholderia sp.]|uniref:MAPEG family protein n=1 Tax=Paraburkholderia sp. TaxID=1926495 RepID=UPI002393E5AC|nr:MAPEG family protein [Paraburkholderia sp.]MDE1184665.1 MAPEG family protein [Paraburkholderia sp.]